MSTTVPPAPIQKASTQSSMPISNGAGKALSLPASVTAQLQSGQAVQVVVTDKPQAGLVDVQTPQGQKIQIQTPMPFSVGATAVLTLPNDANISETKGAHLILNIQTLTATPAKAPPLPLESTKTLIAMPSGVGRAKSIPQPIMAHFTSGKNLELGKGINAMVLSKPQSGQAILQTPQGQIQIESKYPLTIGTSVLLTLTSPSGPPYKLNIHQQPAPASPTPSIRDASSQKTDVFLPTQTVSGTGHTKNLAQPIIKIFESGKSINAMVLSKPQSGQAILQTPQGQIQIESKYPLTIGTSVLLTLTSPSGPPYKLNIHQQPAPASPTPSIRDASSQKTDVFLPTQTVSGTGHTKNLAQPIIKIFESGKSINAMVLSKPQSGQAILQTPQGQIQIESKYPLTIGTSVLLTLTSPSGPPYKLNIHQQPAPASPTPSIRDASSQKTDVFLPTQTVSGTGHTKNLAQPIIKIFESGKSINAMVLSKPQSGQAILQTPQGQIQIESKYPLTIGTSVLLALTSPSGPPYKLNIHQQPLLSATPTSVKSEIVQSLTNGATLTATIIKSQAIIPQQVNVTESIPSKTPNAVRQNTPSPSANIKSAVNSAPPHLPLGGSVGVKINAIQLPNGPALPLVADGQTNFIQGEVIGNTNGRLQIQTTNNTLSLSVHSPPPIGTIVLFSIEGSAVPPPIRPQGLAGQEMMQRWDGLRDALLLLGAGDPAAAAKVMQSMPQIGIKLTATLLFFMNALRGGNVDNWFGAQSMQSLAKLSKSSAAKITNDFQTSQGRATDSANNEWRSYNLPIFTDSEIEKLRLYMKDFKDEDEETDAHEKEGKRFIIEVNFTKLGPFQFDGVAKKKTVDLMVRTHKALEGNMRDDIRLLFTQTIDSLGLTGTIGFHVSAKFDVAPIEQEIIYGGGMTV